MQSTSLHEAAKVKIAKTIAHLPDKLKGHQETYDGHHHADVQKVCAPRAGSKKSSNSSKAQHGPKDLRFAIAHKFRSWTTRGKLWLCRSATSTTRESLPFQLPEESYWHLSEQADP
jgi:hypothetical protein